ncbi:SAM-dependent methyltransferase [Klebsiella pneumoniae]|uniref:SAM-dependent methyltransferase n=1 Tax=Klebsiella pneumoniae TaxID=573 RepID=UPI001E5CCA43
MKEWGYDLWSNDPYGRKQYGLAPKTNGDFAWMQHMFASCLRSRLWYWWYAA